MPLTRDFKETIQARIESDPVFREELFKEGIECLLSGDVDTGKAVLRDYINATIGFPGAWRIDREISQEPDADVRSQRQPPSPKTCFQIIGFLQKQRGVAPKGGRDSLGQSALLRSINHFDRVQNPGGANRRSVFSLQSQPGALPSGCSAK